MAEAWLGELRQIVETSQSFDWKANAAKLNERLGLHDAAELRPSLPNLPFWFNGDVEAIEPDKWALVFSLNHQLNDPKHVYPTSDGVWDYFREFNRKNYYPRFFRPLVKVASDALGMSVQPDDEKHFATAQMVFVELCPYASQAFSLSSQQIRDVSDDAGFKTASRINDLLLNQAHPGVVLINGTRAVESFEGVYAGKLSWTQEFYASTHLPTKSLWHKQGYVATPNGDLPVAGFPFLRTRSTHNANVEVADLAARIAAHVRAPR